MLADAPEEEIHRHGGQIAAPAAEKGGIPQLMDAFRHPGVNAAARDGETQAAIAVNEIQLPDIPVPEVFRVGKLGGVGAEIFQKVVAGAGGNAGHGGVGVPGDAVGRLADGAVPAAGVDTDRFAGLRQTAGHFLRPAGALGQQALAVQAVLLPQAVRHLIDAAGLVLFPGVGIDDENMTHEKAPFRQRFITLCNIQEK